MRLLLLLFFLPCIISSCVNNMEDVKRISFNKNTPDEVMVDFNMNYSESGSGRISVYAAFSESFRNPVHLTQLKDSLRVTFYSETGEAVSTLTAKYGTINHAKNEIMIRDSVRFYHFKKQQLLKTELLYWHQKDSTVSTDKAVYITSPKGNFTGKGLNARQDFSRYVILKPEGSVVIEKENELN
ncbi:MAG: export transporter periplasmic protein LptC [Bacteroidota bacterium]|jgi:LPS export ABC transporter protein LptC|nr:LPS export ABC transporter periplasmic protein LptC [Flavobacteriia bacterium]NBP29205.1 LPS export ABC transporter periplasmic protein LptC [Flavobacteriia bacterium]